MKAVVYNFSGKKSGDVELPDEIFSVPFKNDLVHEVVVSSNSNKRQVIAHTKGRGEVRGGGKKPWKQKGTGRARHGSSRSPIWKGGGVTFGPTNEKNFSKKINKKAKRAALYSVLAQKNRDGEILFIENFSLKEPKTKEALNILENFSKIDGFSDILTKKKNSALITNTEINPNNLKSFSNISATQLDEFRKLNILDLLKYKYLVIISPKESIDFLLSK